MKRFHALPLRKIAAVLIVVSIVTSLVFFMRPMIFPRVNIGVIEVHEAVLYSYVRDNILRQVDRCIKNESIKAVVLDIDCPGGYADAIQEIYMSLLKLKKAKPIVASIIGLGASGGYYLAISADFIYAVPASITGNIGVVATLPERVGPEENVLETGPYKHTGFSLKDFPFKVQELFDIFLDSVEAQRGERLRIDRTELSKGYVYFGEDAVRLGLVDAIGSTQDAIEMAANLARLKQYEVVRASELIEKPFSLVSQLFSRRTGILSVSDLIAIHPPPAFYYIYAPSESRDSTRIIDTAERTPSPASADEEKVILIDRSHGNVFVAWELNVLLTEVVSKGYTFRYLDSSEKLEEMLIQAEALVVINPGEFFSEEELKSIEGFVEKGGKLMLISDPTRTYMSPINSLSAEFAVVFANGYLYNLKENYGNYRNIIVTQFQRSEITRGLERVVLFTSTAIYSKGNEIALTADSTFSSATENSGQYSPIIFAYGEKVLAIGDLTFLTEPYCYIEDNYRLISNIADFLAS